MGVYCLVVFNVVWVWLHSGTLQKCHARADQKPNLFAINIFGAFMNLMKETPGNHGASHMMHHVIGWEAESMLTTISYSWWKPILHHYNHIIISGRWSYPPWCNDHYPASCSIVCPSLQLKSDRPCPPSKWLDSWFPTRFDLGRGCWWTHGQTFLRQDWRSISWH